MRAYPNCTARNSPKENLTEHSIANCSAHAFPLLLFYCQPLIMAKSHHGVHTNPLAGLELTSSHPHSRKKHQCPLVPAAQMLTSTSSSLCALPSFYSFWLKKNLKKIPFTTQWFSDLGSPKLWDGQVWEGRTPNLCCDISGLEDEGFWKLLLQQDGHAASCAKFPCVNWKPGNSSSLKAMGKRKPTHRVRAGTDKDLAASLEKELKQEEMQLSTCLQSLWKAT